LHINGIVQGAYFAEEHIDEYLLEKNGIADGVMVKIHDEFNANSNTLHNSRYHSIPG
jgi:spore coat protein CotH